MAKKNQNAQEQGMALNSKQPFDQGVPDYLGTKYTFNQTPDLSSAQKTNQEKIARYQQDAKNADNLAQAQAGAFATQASRDLTNGDGSIYYVPKDYATQASRELTAEGWMTDYGMSGDPSKISYIKKDQEPAQPSNGGGGSGSGGGSPAAEESAAPAAEAGPYENPYQMYDPNSYEAYVKAQQNLDNINGQRPDAYIYADQAKLDDLYNRIMNPAAYSYDVNMDAAYKNYADQYLRLGQKAMQDTMGQAAGLTGGYGSTYAQNVGQQAYDDYMIGLAGKSADLENQAYSRYLDALNRDINMYGTEKAREQEAYNRWNDDYSRWLAERDAAKADVEDEYSRGYKAWSDENAARDDWYTKMMTLWQTTGKEPTENDMDAAGMSDYEKAAWKKYFADQAAAAANPGYYNPPAGDDADAGSGSGANVYMELLGDIATLKGDYEKKSYSEKSQAYRASVAAIDKTLADGGITQDQANKLKDIARSGMSR